MSQKNAAGTRTLQKTPRLRASRRLSVVLFPAFDWSIGPTHPEREERLLYTQDQLLEEGVEDIEGVTFVNPEPASEADVQRVHLCVPDVASRVTESHLISAGGAITAGERVLSGHADRAFAIIRPPGHHAQRIVHGDRGFCIINTEAIMIERLRRQYGIKKVAIVDTDCHHGDGTQDIYWNDPDTLFISLHQDGRTLYPGTGFPEEFGGPGAIGATINIPLPPQTGDEGYLFVIDRLVKPILEEFKPDLIVNSAGQDNHFSDPITDMRLTAQGYAELIRRLDPQIAVLEGGYSICGALPSVNLGILAAMAGLDTSRIREPNLDREALRQDLRLGTYIAQLCDQMGEQWSRRHRVAAEVKRGNRILKRERQVFYDTDGISETREEAYHLCDSCPGLVRTRSETDRGSSAELIHVPRQACDACVKAGERLFVESTAGCDLTVLQDSRNDRFEKRGCIHG